jgi:phospholipase/lecithinase/hemolysin
MKKIILFCMLMLSMCSLHAQSIKKIIFFGDSLTDNGNIYETLLHVIPKSPPYFEGRFSNGYVWAENVGKYYYDKSYADYSIYAVGGATTLFHMSSSIFISTSTLDVQIDKYLLDSVFRDRSKILFVIWIGGNDYLFDADQNPNTATDKVVERISDEIGKLYDHGARHFLVMNLPDLAKIPDVTDAGKAQKLHTMTLLHNQKLAAAVDAFEQKHEDVNFASIDVYSFFAEAINNLGEFNQKHQTNITNVTEGCWKGGYWITKPLSADAVQRDIERALNEKANRSKDIDVKAMSQFIANTPELARTYQLTQSLSYGNAPCANPDEYLFWDHIHPTAVGHRVIASVVIDTINSSIK